MPPVNFRPKVKLLPHFLIGFREGLTTSRHSHWPRRISPSYSSHWPRGVAHLVSTLSLVYHSPGGGATADEDNKGSRVASQWQVAVFQSSLFHIAGVRRPPASPAPDEV